MTRPVLVKPGNKVNLGDIDPGATKGLDKRAGLARLAKDAARIGELQQRLYAEDRRSLLVVLQGMDTSGKDGTIKGVFSEVAPMGLDIASFVRPSEEELDHDFLWRVHHKLPRRGNIGVFNRSHYEDVLVVRVRNLVDEQIWRARYDQINRFEALMSDLGVRIVKFFLYISRDEQKQRLQARLDDKRKSYKFRMGDLDDRQLWDHFMAAYDDALERCSTEVAPWYIVPADKKWYRNALIARVVAETLEDMAPKLPPPEVDPKKVVIPD